MSKPAVPSYMEIIDFIASGTTPQAVAEYHPSLEAQHRIAELIALEEEGGLSPEEKSELDQFMDPENILRVPRPAPGKFSLVAHEVDEASRRLVIERADRRCEHCLAHVNGPVIEPLTLVGEITASSPPAQRRQAC